MTSITPISASDFSIIDGGNYQTMRGIAASANGSIIYVCMNGGATYGIAKSIDNGNSWLNVYPTPQFSSIACSSDGSIVYAVSLGDGLYKSTDSGTIWNKVTFLPDNTLPGGAANPESPAGGQFPGYELTNIYQVACDSTGTKLIMTTNAAASIYQSIDGGSTWSFIYVNPNYITNPNNPTYVASSADGNTLYAALNNTTNPNPNIIVSKNSGATWASINMLGVYGPFGNLGTNSYGDFVFAIDPNSSLSIFYPTHIDNALLVPAGGNTYVSLGVYNNGNNLIISQNNYPDTSPTITNGAVVLYSVTNKYAPGNLPCFKDDSKILCLKEGKEVYVKIQDIRKGDLVKTLKHGYVAVDMIGKRDIYHIVSQERNKEQLYKCSHNEYPEVFEDLIITGCHAILVDNFVDEEQRQETIEILGKIYVTNSKYRLPACADLRASVYEIPGTYTIYHLALENDNYYTNYGIYANGLLVESCSKRYLKELSNMSLIE